MDLHITYTTNKKDLVIDLIKVRLNSGDIILLDWDESKIHRYGSKATVFCSGVYFNGEKADGKLCLLEECTVVAVKTYSKAEGGDDYEGKGLNILSMEFAEDSGAGVKMSLPIWAGDTFELTKGDIRIFPDINVSEDGRGVGAEIEIWFDVDRKFGLDTRGDEGTWLNMYAMYNPFSARVTVTCVVSSDTWEYSFPYRPTARESRLFREMITAKIQEVAGCSPREFCRLALL